MEPSITGSQQKIYLKDNRMKRFLLLLLFVSCSFELFAKEPIKGIPKVCQTVKPRYASGRNSFSALSYHAENGFGQRNDVSARYWDAYSDRDDNITYLNSSISKPYSSLSFREKVRIAKIKGGFALVYSVPVNDDSDYPTIPAAVEWKGWIPMGNLIYYDYPLVDENGGSRTVFLKDSMEFSGTLRLIARLYDSPMKTEKFSFLPNQTNSLFYLIKEENGFCLLSTAPVINEKTMYGWVSSQDAVQWNSRIALEPTWDHTDYAFFSEKDINCQILDENNSAIGEIDFDYQRTVSFDPDRFRMRGNEWRFPLIYNNQFDSVSTCAISGRSRFLAEPSRKIEVSIETTEDEEDSKHINIIFVVDGSRLYEPFFPIMADRIKALGNENPSVRAGMIIYHDSRNSKYMTESFPLSEPGDNALYDFIDRGGDYGFKDNLSEAPLFSTLHQCALDPGFDEEDENIIIVIGGRGDSSDTDISLDEIANILVRKNIQMFVLQVQNNPLTAGYRLFEYQLDNLIRSATSSRLNESVASYKTSNEDGILMTNYFPVKKGDKVFESIASISSGLMSEDVFASELDRLMAAIGEAVSDVSSLSSMYPDYFRYCFLKTSSYSRKIFKEVALFSKAELEGLLSVMRDLNNLSLTGSDNREAFVRTLLESVGSPSALLDRGIFLYMYDQSKVQEILKDLGYLRVFAIVEGLAWSNSYEGRSLKDIMNPKVVTSEEFKYILKSISRHYYRLLEVRDTPSIYQSIINGAPYYWVPKEDLL